MSGLQEEPADWEAASVQLGNVGQRSIGRHGNTAKRASIGLCARADENRRQQCRRVLERLRSLRNWRVLWRSGLRWPIGKAPPRIDMREQVLAQAPKGHRLQACACAPRCKPAAALIPRRRAYSSPV